MTSFNEPARWRLALACVLVPLAVIAFWPSPIDYSLRGHIAHLVDFLHRYGALYWLDYRMIEKVANVVMFIPLGFIARLAFPAGKWWQVGAFGLIISGCIELGQLLFLSNRFASVLDVVTNTSGATIGALLAFAVLKRWRPTFQLWASDKS